MGICIRKTRGFKGGLMTFLEKITGSDIKREHAEMKKRVEKLPTEYQKTWDVIFAKLAIRSDFTGRNLTPLYLGILDMLEEMSSLGKSIDEIFGGDIDGFCNQLTVDEPSYDVRDKWRKKLNKKVEKRFK